jgi:hypothetical protein
MPSTEHPPSYHPSAAAADDFHSADPDLPDQGTSMLADLVAASVAAFITALALLTACGWLTTLWGAALLCALLTCSLVLVLGILMRQ